VSHGDPRTIVFEEEFKGGHTKYGMHKRNSKRGLIFQQNDPMRNGGSMIFFKTKNNEGIE
jgi:hypothetical protein